MDPWMGERMVGEVVGVDIDKWMGARRGGGCVWLGEAPIQALALENDFSKLLNRTKKDVGLTLFGWGWQGCEKHYV